MEAPNDIEGPLDLRKRIDKDLPDPTRLSLSQWYSTWNRLKESGSREDRDRFALTGHYLDPLSGRPTRSRMDFYDHRIPENTLPQQLSDIDSVVGIVMHQFPIVAGVVLKYFMLLSPSHTLEANLHLPPIKVRDAHGPDLSVRPHQVPNGRFMEMEPQGMIRICFPRAERGASGTSCLTNHKLELLYDLAVHPAAMEVLPRELTGSWPGKWGDEQFRAQNIRERGNQSENADHGRQVQHSGRDVHSVYLNALVERMRERVNTTDKLAWAKSFFFICEMRGLKTREGSMHLPPQQPVVDQNGHLDEESPRARAVHHILACFNTDNFEENHWFIDFGLNFTVPSPLGGYDCPLPAVEAHASILAHVLEVDIEKCVEWVKGTGGHYERDELAQLKALAGFRFTNPNPDSNGICYIQLYTSDKATIYNLNLAKHAKRITAWQTLDDWDKARMHHFQPLVEVFRNASAAHDMYVRLEVRAEFSQYPFVQLRVPDEKVRTWMYSADPKHYWGWKLFRLESIYSVLRMWMDHRGSLTLGDLPEVGSMLASLVWMTNALVNRPDEGGTWDEIRDASSVHGVSQGKLVPVWPLQAHFLHSLRFSPDQQPRLSSQRTVSIKTLLYICSSKKPHLTESELCALMAKSGPADDFEPDTVDEQPSRAHLAFPIAASNKQRIVNVRSRERQEDLFEDVLPEPKRVRRYDSEDEDYEERTQPTPRSEQLTNILTDLPVQIFEKCPKQKGGRSWSLLDSNSPLITHSLFNSLETLECAFPSRIMWGYDSTKWTKVVDVILPTTTESKKAYQGFHCLDARKEFLGLQRTLLPEERMKLVQEARKFVHEHWVWLPYGVSKLHLWATGMGNTGKSLGSVGALAGGPWIVLNPKFKPAISR